MRIYNTFLLRQISMVRVYGTTLRHIFWILFLVKTEDCRWAAYFTSVESKIGYRSKFDQRYIGENFGKS